MRASICHNPQTRYRVCPTQTHQFCFPFSPVQSSHEEPGQPTELCAFPSLNYRACSHPSCQQLPAQLQGLARAAFSVCKSLFGSGNSTLGSPELAEWVTATETDQQAAAASGSSIWSSCTPNPFLPSHSLLELSLRQVQGKA